MDQVWIRLAAPEIRLRDAVDHRSGRRTETVLQKRPGIGARDRVHGVEAHPEATGPEQLSDAIEIEKCLHEDGVVDDGIDDFYSRVATCGYADLVKVDIGSIDDRVGADLTAFLVDRISKRVRIGPVLGVNVAVR